MNALIAKERYHFHERLFDYQKRMECYMVME